MDGVDDSVALVSAKVVEAVVVSVSEWRAVALLLICQRRRRVVGLVAAVAAKTDVTRVARWHGIIARALVHAARVTTMVA